MPPFKSSDNVLVVADSKEFAYPITSSILSEIGNNGRVLFFNTEELTQEVFGQNKVFDAIVSISAVEYDSKTLSEFMKVLKLGGSLVLRLPIYTTANKKNANFSASTEQEIFLALTLAGFVDVQTKVIESNDLVNQLLSRLSTDETTRNFLQNSLVTLEVSSTKPDFQVGSAMPLKGSLSKKVNTSQTIVSKTVWQVSANDINENDLEDEDALLGEADLKFVKTAKKNR